VRQKTPLLNIGHEVGTRYEADIFPTVSLELLYEIVIIMFRGSIFELFRSRRDYWWWGISN